MKQPKQIIESLNLLFYATVGLPMLLFGWVYLPLKDVLTWQESQALWHLGFWRYLLAAAMIVLAAADLRSTSRQFQQVSKDWSLPIKLQHFTMVFRRSYLLVMLLSLFSVAVLYLTRNQLFVVVYAFLLFLVSLYRPSFQRMCRHLPLTKEEQKAIKH